LDGLTVKKVHPRPENSIVEILNLKKKGFTACGRVLTKVRWACCVCAEAPNDVLTGNGEPVTEVELDGMLTTT
jgi:hypothetical protein